MFVEAVRLRVWAEKKQLSACLLSMTAAGWLNLETLADCHHHYAMNPTNWEGTPAQRNTIMTSPAGASAILLMIKS